MKELTAFEYNLVAGGGDKVRGGTSSGSSTTTTTTTTTKCEKGSLPVDISFGGLSFHACVPTFGLVGATTTGIQYSGGTGGGLTSYSGGTYAGGTYDGGNSPTSAYC